MVPEKGESKADFLKRATDSGMSADDAQAAWLKATQEDVGSTYATPAAGESLDAFVARFMAAPEAVAQYPEEAGRKSAAEVKFAASDNAKKPYGDVAYADPGYQKDGVHRYPIDTEGHIRSAWNYIHQADNAKPYSGEQVAKIKDAIEAAWKAKIDKAGPPAAEPAGSHMAEQFGEMKDVEIFSTGTWSGSKKVTVTATDLDNMVRAWNEVNDKVTGYRPPLKLGHDDAQKFIGQNKGSGAPALGWVHNLRRIGNKVVADFKDVPSKLLDMIRQKRYNSVSIEMLPSLEFDGKNYSTVLTAVAILGAELPAVKGLKELSATLGFAGAQAVTLSQKEEDTNMVTYTQEQHDALVAAAVGKAKTEFEAEHTGKVTKLDGDLKAAVARADTAEAALAQFKSEAETNEITMFVDGAIKEGKVMPAEKDNLIAVGKSMAQGAKVKLGEKEQSGLDAFKAMITARPVSVNFTQAMRGKGERENGGASASSIVTERANAKVAAAGGADKLSFKMAVDAVLTEDVALKQRYFAEI